MGVSIKRVLAVAMVLCGVVTEMALVSARAQADSSVCSSEILQKSADSTEDCFPDEAAFCMNYRCVDAFVTISGSDDFACGLPDGATKSSIKDNAATMLKKCSDEQKETAVKKAKESGDSSLSITDPNAAISMSQGSFSLAVTALVAAALANAQ